MRIWQLARRMIRAVADLFSPDERSSVDDASMIDLLTPSRDDNCLGRLGKYRVTRVLGSGGMGTVLLATDPVRDRQVAIKVLLPNFANDQGTRRRFLREGKIAMSVHHPNVLATHAIESCREQPFIVSDYVAGGSLQDRLDKGELFACEVVRELGVQIASGLAAIHAKRLVHTDIKPSNVLLGDGGRVAQISDFGLARVVDASGKASQRTTFATPQFASPEQVQGLPLDHRSDLFSLGSTLYAVCTGQPPFPGESSVAIARDVCNSDARPIRELNPTVPDPLVKIIEKLMAKLPALRFQSAAEVISALQECSLSDAS